MNLRNRKRRCQRRVYRRSGNPYTAPGSLGWNLHLATGWDSGTGILTAAAGSPNLTQLTASKQPAVVVINGRTYLRSDGVDDFLQTTATVDRSGVPYSVIWAGRRRAACPLNGIAWDRNGFAFNVEAASQINAKDTAISTARNVAGINGNAGINGWNSVALNDDTDVVIGVTFDPPQAAAAEISRFEHNGSDAKNAQIAAANNNVGNGNFLNTLFMRNGTALPGAFDWFGSAEISGSPSNADMAEVTNWFLWELGLL